MSLPPCGTPSFRKVLTVEVKEQRIESAAFEVHNRLVRLRTPTAVVIILGLSGLKIHATSANVNKSRISPASLKT